MPASVGNIIILSIIMQKKKLHISVIIGTGREGRMSVAVAHTLMTILTSRADIEPELVDVKDHLHLVSTPPWGVGGAKSEPTAWQKIAEHSDAFLFVVPEYNRGYPGEFKILLDALDTEYRGKPVALCGVSSGVYGGARVITHLQPVLLYLGLIPTREVLNIPNVQNHVQDGVYVADEKMLKRIDVVVSELVLYARRFLAPVEA